MSNLEKYNEVFISRLRISSEQLNSAQYQSLANWDSVGQMALIAAMEEEFNVSFDTEDILCFTSYERGKEVLGRLNINL